MNRPAPGSSQDRTWLAWRRTAAGLLVVCLVLTRDAVLQGGWVKVAPVLALLALAATLCVSFLRAGAWRTPSAHDPEVTLVRDGRVPAAVVVAVGAVALVVVLVSWT
jgi:uncharacterized membrane protein YidH (DUF202 family)